jgi:phospholipid-binding lipoprotein MlaA
MQVQPPLKARLSPAGAIVIAGLLLAGCTAAPPGAEFNDPYEPVNRQIHDFNKQVDQALLRPAGQVAAQLPLEIRTPVSNFAGNVGLPGMVLNGLLQGDVGGAATNTMRFLINSTVGVFGLLDPAGAIGLAEEDTDFGETLAVWGVTEGAYLELPFLGPSTERDAAGRVVDLLINPLDRLGYPEVTQYATPARVAEQVIDRGTFGDTLDSILYDSADSYAQARLIFLQNRRFGLGEAAQSDYLDPYAADAYINPYEDQ